MKIHTYGAFSMVEAMVAAVVFTIAAAGILTAMSRARHPVANSDQRVRAAAYGKQVLDGLRAGLSTDTWNSVAWTDGAHDASGPEFNAEYIVTTDAAGGKKVDLNIYW